MLINNNINDEGHLWGDQYVIKQIQSTKFRSFQDPSANLDHTLNSSISEILILSKSKEISLCLRGGGGHVDVRLTLTF